ncbi:hypothetical protein KJ765_00185 [Candidatus Micrarchaeota archaeon]|nr:hypothetical protein [Candidatus Micrarchaeota archaeon]
MAVKTARDVESLKADVRTLDSKISLIAQKMNTIEKNEEVIGRTIVAHNQRIKELEEQKGSGPSESSSSSANTADLNGLREELKELKKDVQEMRYILNSINPLEFVTMDQIKELMKERK